MMKSLNLKQKSIIYRLMVYTVIIISCCVLSSMMETQRPLFLMVFFIITVLCIFILETHSINNCNFEYHMVFAFMPMFLSITVFFCLSHINMALIIVLIFSINIIRRALKKACLSEIRDDAAYFLVWVCIVCYIITTVKYGINDTLISEAKNCFYEEKNEYDSSKDISYLGNISESKFLSMSISEKKEFFDCVVRIDSDYLGLSEKIDVIFDYIDKDNVAGFYNHENKTITIDKEIVQEKSLYNNLSIILHELHHAYIYECIGILGYIDDSNRSNLLLVRELKTYQYEQENYVASYEDLDKYNMQHLEIDADNYAEERLAYYYRNYIGKN